MKKSLMVTIAASALVVSAHAVVIEGFESPSFTLPTVPATWNVSLSSTTGVTEGTKALHIGMTDTSFAWVQLGIDSSLASTLSSSTSLLFDVTVGPTNSQWVGFLIATNSASGWGQQSTGVNPPVSTTAPVTTTVTVDLATLNGGNPYNWGGVTNWLQLQLGVNSQAGADIYVDNIRTVAAPEPTTVAALGLGALALVRRRRNRR